MLEVVKQSLIYLFISAIASGIFAPIMIWFMYRFKYGVVGVKETKLEQGTGSNKLFRKLLNMEERNGTPNMGGLLVLVVVPIVSLFTLNIDSQIKALLIGFVIFGLWGLLDVIVTNYINSTVKDEKIRARLESFEFRLMKLLIAIVLNSLVTLILYSTGTLTEISIFQGLSISFVPWLIPIIGAVSQFAIYSGELTDGADGLMIGIMGIIYTGLAILLLVQGNFTYIPLIGIILGSIVVDLYFNIPPARFWNGGPSTMPLAFTAFFIGLVTGNIIPYFIISSITWIIMMSSTIQILSLKFLHRRVFKIAPIHHHFQANGWPMYKVVMRFWLFTVVTAILGILVGLIIY